MAAATVLLSSLFQIAVDAAPVPRSVATVALTVQGSARDDHLGHGLAGPAVVAPGEEPWWVAAGGSKWDAAQPRHREREAVELFTTAGVRRLRIEGHEEGDRFGFQVALVPGLAAADGGAELVVSAPRGPLADAERAAELGALHFFRAVDLAAAEPGSTLSSAQAALVVRGTAQWGRFGWSLRAGGDLDGDQVPDLCVGAPGGPHAPDAGGQVWFLPGARIRALLEGGARRDCRLDDPELGARRLLEGAPGQHLGASLALWAPGEAPSTLAAGAPGVERDLATRALRATHGEGAGEVWLLRLGPGAVELGRETIRGPWPGAQFGAALALWGPGGRPRLAVGAPGAADREGGVGGAVWWAELGALDAPQVLAAPRPGGRFGAALAADPAGRWLGVGAPDDTWLGSGETLEQGHRRGAVFLFEATAEGATAEGVAAPAGGAALRLRASFHGEDARDHLGFALAPGAAPGEFWVGALGWPGVEGTELGRCYLVSAPR
jgi:hypothetical protein